jgi:alginate O-acetyltransferase complex protein AlgI
MTITSLYFILLSVISVFAYYLLDTKYRVLFLTLISSGFIVSYSYWLLIYVLLFSLINYYFGIKAHTSKYKRGFFRMGIIINLAQLMLLKYSSFAIDPFLRILNSSVNISHISLVLIPIGISFFTLQGIGYLININKGWETPEKDFIHFFLYIIFYPKFLSGPIERSNHFLPQIKVNKPFDALMVTSGLRTALFGIFKKVAIANQLTPLINGAYSNVNSSDSGSLWIVLLLQPLYLYFDFSGYTDIAIGIARTFGFDLVPNFNRPFLAENVTSFWKSFHISLSSWFNDYVFRLTSFKYRKWGIRASIFAVFVTWILFGIWHGAGWTFMILGFLQALAINFEFFTKELRISLFSRVPAYLKKWIGRVFTYLFYAVSLVFFFSNDIKLVPIFFSKLFVADNSQILYINRAVFFMVLIFIMIFIIMEVFSNDFKSFYFRIEKFWENDKNIVRIQRWVLYLIIITCVVVMGNDVQDFIYFKF